MRETNDYDTTWTRAQVPPEHKPSLDQEGFQKDLRIWPSERNGAEPMISGSLSGGEFLFEQEIVMLIITADIC